MIVVHAKPLREAAEAAARAEALRWSRSCRDAYTAFMDEFPSGTAEFADDHFSPWWWIDRQLSRRTPPQEGSVQRPDWINSAMNIGLIPRPSLRGLDLRREALIGLAFCNADMRGVNLAGANLTNVNLSNSNLQHANLRGCNLRWAMLRRVDLRYVVAADADFRASRFKHSECMFADFRRTQFDGAMAQCANFSDSCVGGTTWKEADITGTCFARANFGETEQHAADFRKARTEYPTTELTGFHCRRGSHVVVAGPGMRQRLAAEPKRTYS